MNFLEICQRVRQECGISGDGPISVVGQTNHMKKIVDRTQRAWVDIQTSKPFWKFLRAKTAYTLIPGTDSYIVSAALPGGLGLTSVDKWDVANAYIYETSTQDESKLEWQTYSFFRSKYRTHPSGRPTKICPALNGTIEFEHNPDKAYVVTLDYWQTPERLVSNADIPALPEQFHDVIVWKAVMAYAGSEGASALYSFAKGEYDAMYLQLVIDQMEVPLYNKAHPIARGATRTPQTFAERA